jgi:hypothetical protein
MTKVPVVENRLAALKARLPADDQADLAELERRLMAALMPYAGEKVTEAAIEEIADICTRVEAQWLAERARRSTVVEGSYESRGGAYLGPAADDLGVPNVRWMYYHP